MGREGKSLRGEPGPVPDALEDDERHGQKRQAKNYEVIEPEAATEEFDGRMPESYTEGLSEVARQEPRARGVFTVRVIWVEKPCQIAIWPWLPNLKIVPHAMPV